eukprot:COSAG01_NODE_74360_length_216_cov_43.512821_1_plen_59_part_10
MNHGCPSTLYGGCATPYSTQLDTRLSSTLDSARHSTQLDTRHSNSFNCNYEAMHLWTSS